MSRLPLLLAGLALTGACNKDPILQPDRPSMHFVVVDTANDQVLMIDELRGTSWTVDLPSAPTDIVRMGDDEVLVTMSTGLIRLDLETGDEVWRLDGYVDVTTAQPRAEGGILFGIKPGQRLLELRSVDAFGDETSSKATVPGDHTYTGLIRETADDHIFYPNREQGINSVYERDGGLADILVCRTDGLAYEVEPVGTESMWVGTGSDLRVVELDRTYTRCAELSERSFKPYRDEHGLVEIRGFERIDDLVVATNWMDPRQERSSDVHAVAINADGEDVWVWEDASVGAVSNLIVLETFLPERG